MNNAFEGETMPKKKKKKRKKEKGSSERSNLNNIKRNLVHI